LEVASKREEARDDRELARRISLEQPSPLARQRTPDGLDPLACELGELEALFPIVLGAGHPARISGELEASERRVQ
jgi:hypothetical protein